MTRWGCRPSTRIWPRRGPADAWSRRRAWCSTARSTSIEHRRRAAGRGSRSRRRRERDPGEPRRFHGVLPAQLFQAGDLRADRRDGAQGRRAVRAASAARRCHVAGPRARPRPPRRRRGDRVTTPSTASSTDCSRPRSPLLDDASTIGSGYPPLQAPRSRPFLVAEHLHRLQAPRSRARRSTSATTTARCDASS